MKLTIIGASSGIGLVTVAQALARGHEVIAMARDTDPIPDHARLTKLNGNATSVTDLKRAVADTGAVIITIGTKNKKAVTLFSKTADALLQITADIPKTAPLLVVTGFGTGDSGPYLSFFMRMVINFFLKSQYEDKARMEERLAGSSLNWEMVRPGRLTDGPKTGTYHTLSTLFNGMQVGKIARADVADFLLNEAEKPTYLRQYVALTA